MEPIALRPRLRPHLEQLRHTVDTAARTGVPLKMVFFVQIFTETPLAVAHAAWGRMWLLFVVLMVIAAVGNPSSSVLSWPASAGVGLAVVWLTITALSLMVLYGTLIGYFVAGWRRRRTSTGV